MANSLTVRLDAELALEIERIRRETGTSRGRLVRDALRRHLASSDSRRFAVLGRYKGAVVGPTDLSTSRKHLSGFGRSRPR